MKTTSKAQLSQKLNQVMMDGGRNITLLFKRFSAIGDCQSVLIAKEKVNGENSMF
jgi:hypothetical protein